MRLFWKTTKPTASFIPKLKVKASKIASDIALQVWNGAVDRTPVASGELRASWNLSVGRPNFTTVGNKNSSPGVGVSALPRPVTPALVKVPLNKARYFIANGKSYANNVEHGSNTIRPHLMLTRAVQSIGF